MIGKKHFLAVSIIILGWAGFVCAQSPSQDIIHKLSQIKQPRSPFRVELWMNQKSYQPGDSIEFSFRTERDCYLTLIDVATEGVIRVIFPNQFHPDNHVQANRIYSIPGNYGFEMKITGPLGIERIKAIATTRKMNIFDMNFEGGEYSFFETNVDSKVATRGIGGLKSNLQKQNAWAETSLEFEIKKDVAVAVPPGTKRSLWENTGRPAPKPVPSTGTMERTEIRDRGLEGTENWPAPKPVPGTGTQDRMPTRGLRETEDWPAPKPVPGTVTQELK